MRNSLMIPSSAVDFWLSVGLSGTTSIDVFPFLFFDTEFDCKFNVPFLFLLRSLPTTGFWPCELSRTLSFGAISAEAEKVVGSGGFDLCPSGCENDKYILAALLLDNNSRQNMARLAL